MEADLFYNIYCCTRKGIAAMNALFDSQGDHILPEQFLIMSLLTQRSPLNQKEISESMIKDKTAITRAIDDLVGRGMILRQTNPEDRRQNLITLTDEGERMIDKLVQVYLKWEEKMLQDITDAEKTSFLRMIRKVQQKI